MVFESIVQTMMEMDVFQLFFPWLLVTALTYGALNKSDFFDDDSITGAVALSIGFIAMAGVYMFVPTGLFQNFAAAIAFVIFGIIGLIVILALAGVDVSEFEDPESKLPARLGVLLFVIIFVGILLTYFGVDYITEMVNTDSDVLLQGLVLLFLVIVVGMITRSGGEE